MPDLVNKMAYGDFETSLLSQLYSAQQLTN
jgi:hypothetical protein